MIQSILRTYGGILEFETQVDIPLIAKKTGLHEMAVDTMLKQVQKDGIITYTSQTGDFEISFLAPREDELTINTFSKKIKSLHQVKRNNLQSMFDFIENTTICRNRLLLQYFEEETSQECGKCDICKRSEQVPPSGIKNGILNLLQDKTLSSRDLVTLLNSDEKQILLTLRDLLEEEKIQLNYRNEYGLASK